MEDINKILYADYVLFIRGYTSYPAPLGEFHPGHVGV